MSYPHVESLLSTFLSKVEDVFDTSVIPLIVGIIICLLFITIDIYCDKSLKVAYNKLSLFTFRYY